MEPDIKVTDETRLIVDAYLQKQYKRQEKRYAKEALERATRDKEFAEKKAYKPVRETEPRPGNPKTSAFSKHIEKLGKIKTAVENCETVGGIPLNLSKDDAKRAEAAGKYIETAMAMLATITRD